MMGTWLPETCWATIRRAIKIRKVTSCWFFLFTLNYDARSTTHQMYKDKLQNCSCNQFHYICTYKQVEKNSITKNRGGNKGSEKWIEKNTVATDKLIGAVHSSYVCMRCVRYWDGPKCNSVVGGKWLEENVLGTFEYVFHILVMKVS